MNADDVILLGDFVRPTKKPSESCPSLFKPEHDDFVWLKWKETERVLGKCWFGKTVGEFGDTMGGLALDMEYEFMRKERLTCKGASAPTKNS